MKKDDLDGMLAEFRVLQQEVAQKERRLKQLKEMLRPCFDLGTYVSSDGVKVTIYEMARRFPDLEECEKELSEEQMARLLPLRIMTCMRVS